MPSGVPSLVLPQHPKSLPDEILGSWLAATAADNAIVGRAFLFGLLGIEGQRHQYPIADFIGKTELLLRAAQALGCPRDEAIQTLTTRPYHLCFDAPRRGPEVAGSSGRVSEVAYFGRRALRICPICIDIDYKRHGRPYFHRSHQLLGTHVCHLHGVDLVLRCHRCGVAVRLVVAELPLAPLRCQCGSEFRQAGRPRALEDPWRRLAVFEHEALTLPAGRLSAEMVKPALRAVLREKFTNRGRHSPLRALVATFGDQGLLLLRNSLSDPLDLPIRPPKSVQIADVKAPLLGALFVAAGCDVTQALCLVDQKHSEPSRPHRRVASTSWRSERPLNRDEARAWLDAALESGSVRTRAHVRSRMRFTFWCLLLHDGDWFLRRLPPLRGNGKIVVPSIVEDRARLAEPSEGFSVYRVEARVRAFYRDREWLSTKMLATRTNERAGMAQDVPMWKQGPPRNLVEAKEQLERSIEEWRLRTRTLIRARRPHVFWLLTMEDPAWFRSRVPAGRGTGLIDVPSIEDDRTSIKQGKAGSRVRYEARIRAFHRDRAWLEAYLSEQLESERGVRHEQILERLHAARAALMNEPGRPRRWTSRMAAEATGKSPAELLNLASTQPRFGGARTEALEDYLRRLIAWGIEDSARRNQALRLGSLCRSIWSHKSRRDLARSILSALLGGASARG